MGPVPSWEWPLSTAGAAAFSARSFPITAALGFLSLHGSGWALWVAFKCHLPWDLLKCFISAHLSSAGMTFNSSLLLLPDSDHLGRKVAMAISYSAQPKNPSFCILLNAAFWGPYTWRAKARVFLHLLQPGVWSPGVSLSASLAAPYPFAKPNGLFWFFLFCSRVSL